MITRRRQSIGAATVLAMSILIGVGAAWADDPGGAHRVRAPGAGGSAAANQAAASADAVQLLSKLVLPAGDRRSATEPEGGGLPLSQPAEAPATPNLVDLHQWWLVPGSPASVLDFVATHRPAGSRLVFAGHGGGSPQGLSFSQVGYGWPPVRMVLSARSLGITAVPLSGGVTGVRVDAQDVWIVPRPPSSEIPSSLTGLWVTVTRLGRRIQGPLRFSSAVKVRRAIALLNQLPLFQPGVISCPADFSNLIHLAFSGRANQRATAVVDASGCLQVGLTIDGRRQPTLAGGGFPGSGLPMNGSLVRRLASALRVKFQTGIPVPFSRPARLGG